MIVSTDKFRSYFLLHFKVKKQCLFLECIGTYVELDIIIICFCILTETFTVEGDVKLQLSRFFLTEIFLRNTLLVFHLILLNILIVSVNLLFKDILHPCSRFSQ